MKTMKIRKWMILSFTLLSLTCMCFMACNNTSETPAELFMLASANNNYENCLEKASSSKDKKQCEITRKKVLMKIETKDIRSSLARGVIDDEFPCPVGDCPDDLIERLRDDWQSLLSKVVLRKGQSAIIKDNKGNVIGKLVPGGTKSDFFKNHFVGKLSIEQGVSPAILSISDKNNKTQYTIKIPSK